MAIRKRLGVDSKEKKATKGINREALLKVLEKVKSGIAKGVQHQFGVSDHFVLMNDKVCAYNDEIGVVAVFDSGVDCSVLADDFYGLLSKMSDETIKMKLDSNQLIVKGGQAEFGLGYIEPTKELLAFFELKKTKWQKLSKCFFDAVSLCMYSVATDDNRIAFTGICFKGMNVFSTDSKRASWYKRKVAFERELVMPVSALAKLIKYDLAEYSIGDGWMFFRDKENTIFSCRLLDVDFPDCLFLFPKPEEQKELDSIVLVQDEMKDMLMRASVLLADVDFFDRHMELIFDDTLICEVKRKERGWFREEIENKGMKHKCSFFINPDFLLQALKLMPEMDLYFVDNTKVLLVKDTFKCVIALFSERK